LATADQLFPNAANVFPYDNIDAYSDRPLQTTLANINEGILANQDDPTKPWSGADNTNHFFTHQDLFDPNKTSGGPLPAQVGFTNRLLNAGNGISTYDRYTFYRLLSQLGTDSAPEQNKMNLNYRNMTNGVVVPNLEANFYPWTAIEFFTIAADRMLRDYSQEWLAENPQAFTNTFGTIITNNFGITNIPVWVDGRFVYTPAIQRVLQLAANIYDATTNNNTAALGTNFPSVFRPTFWVTNENGYTDVYIDGYEQVVSVTGTNDLQLALPVDITDLLLGASIVNYPNGVNVYGVPWIIGAKKGFPNFNEFSMLTLVGIDRKLEITRPSFDASLSLYSTNQMYILSISNSLGVECWNSYATNYFPSPGGLTIVARDNLSMTLSNMDNGTTPAFWSAAPNPANFPLNNAVTIPAGPPGWPGTVPWTITSARPNPNSGSFDIPLMANATFLTNSI
jgi:hypothetical protein